MRNTDGFTCRTGVLIAVVAAPVWAQVTQRASVHSSEVQGNGISECTKISADDHCIAVASEVSNLVVGDTDGFVNLFVQDRLTGQTARACVDSGCVRGRSGSPSSSISIDGPYVAFESTASVCTASLASLTPQALAQCPFYSGLFAVEPDGALCSAGLQVGNKYKISVDLVPYNNCGAPLPGVPFVMAVDTWTGASAAVWGHGCDSWNGTSYGGTFTSEFTLPLASFSPLHVVRFDAWVDPGNSGVPYVCEPGVASIAIPIPLRALEDLSYWGSLYPPHTEQEVSAEVFEAEAMCAECHAEIDTDDLDPLLASRVTDFLELLASAGAHPTLTSAFRPTAYQAHLRSIRDQYELLLRRFPEAIGGHLIVDACNGGTRPQLAILNPAGVCSNLVDEVNNEIRKHCLVSGHNQTTPYLPAVNRPGQSRHEYGLAVDISVAADPELVQALARIAGLSQPCVGDAVHFQLAEDDVCVLKD